MRTPQRNFIVEYKTNRSQAQAGPRSIWGNLDLKAVARQVEADGILPDATRSDAGSIANDDASVLALAFAQQPQSAIKDAPRVPNRMLLAVEDGVSLQGLSQELPAIEAAAAHDNPQVTDESTRTSASDNCAPMQERAVTEDCFQVSTDRNDEDDLDVLEEENRRLKRLMIIKLGQENAALRSMLKRFEYGKVT